MATPTALGQMPGTTTTTSLDPLLLECRDSYKISEEAYKNSIAEGREVINFYHNRQYTANQLKVLAENGQPAETFNVVKMMAHAMLGYMETVVSQINIEPRYRGSAVTALLLNDVVDFTLEQNDFSTTSKRMKLDGLLTGLMVAYEEVIPTGQTDEYGRMINEIKISHVPSWQCRLDPMSSLDDYSDAKTFSHFKWIREEQLAEMFSEEAIRGLTEYYNFLDGDTEADYAREYTGGREEGRYRQHDSYLIVKTIIRWKGKTYSLIWNDEYILEKKEITGQANRFRITKMSNSDISEYYGPFRDITETQKAINQALLQIQLLVNTSKAFVEENAVDNMEEFKELFNRINAIIPVNDLQGIRVEDMSRDVAAQYTILDQALSRIKMVLGVNDSFLGQAFASDSGRKVALQTQSSASQMTMVTDKVQFFFKMIGTDIVALIKQYYKAEQVFSIADPLNSSHYAEINKPIQMPTGEVSPDGELVTSLVWTEKVDDNGKPILDKDNNIQFEPLNQPDTDLEFTEIDIKVVASRGNNADERNQLMLETFLNGPAGQATLQMAPATYFRTLAMQMSEFGTKHSLEIARLLMELAIGIEEGKIDPRLAMAGGDIQSIMGGAMGGNNGAGGSAGGTMPSNATSMPQQQGGPQSPTLGLPQTGGKQ